MEYKFLLDIGLIILFVKVFGIITGKINMPKMLGGLIAGIVLGPAVLNIIQLTPSLEFLESLGIIFIMFFAGMETSLKKFISGTQKYIVIAIVGVVIPLMFGFLFSKFYTTDNSLNLFFGMVMTITSVSITVESLIEMNKIKTNVGRAILGAGVVDDIIGILFLSLILNNGNISFISLLNILIKILIFFALSIIIGFIMFRFLEWLEKRVAKREELPIFSISFALLLSYLAEVFGINGIIGAYIAGLVVGNTKQGKLVRSKIEVLVHMIFTPISFASIGLKLNTLLLPLNIWLFIIIFSIMAIISKVIGCGIGAKICKYKSKECLQIGIGMITRGEVAFIMMEEAQKFGIINEEIFSILIITVCLMTLITPIFLYLSFKDKSEKIKESMV